MGLRREQRDYWTKWNGEAKPVLDAARVTLAMLQEIDPSTRAQVASASFPDATFKATHRDDDLAELEEHLHAEGPASEIRVVVGDTRDGYGVLIGADKDGVSVTTSGPDAKRVKHVHGIAREMMRQTALGEGAEEASLPHEPTPSAPPGPVALSESNVWIEIPPEHVRIERSAPASPASKPRTGVLHWIEDHGALVTAAATIIAALLVIVFAA